MVRFFPQSSLIENLLHSLHRPECHDLVARCVLCFVCSCMPRTMQVAVLKCCRVVVICLPVIACAFLHQSMRRSPVRLEAVQQSSFSSAASSNQIGLSVRLVIARLYSRQFDIPFPILLVQHFCFGTLRLACIASVMLSCRFAGGSHAKEKHWRHGIPHARLTRSQPAAGVFLAGGHNPFLAFAPSPVFFIGFVQACVVYRYNTYHLWIFLRN